MNLPDEMRPTLDQAFSHLNLKWHILQEEVPVPGNGTLRHFVLSPGREEIGFRLEWPGHSMA